MPAVLALGVALPLEHATVVIESLPVDDDVVHLQVYGFPWTFGEYWPVAVPSLDIRAVDDAGADHTLGPGDSRRYHPTHEGSGEFVLWPPVGAGVRRVRVVATTLWEAAWADIELPGRER
ncbi:MAG: hypothetical protein ACRD0L_16510 [Acidimicrobiales bacterium]